MGGPGSGRGPDDITGQVFGAVRAVRLAQRRPPIWRCVCEICGRSVLHTTKRLALLGGRGGQGGCSEHLRPFALEER
jgi:hypothetical protein